MMRNSLDTNGAQSIISGDGDLRCIEGRLRSVESDVVAIKAGCARHALAGFSDKFSHRPGSDVSGHCERIQQ